jgi:hypothetical protein
MACSTLILAEDCWWRCCSQLAVCSGVASLLGFFGAALT